MSKFRWLLLFFLLLVSAFGGFTYWVNSNISKPVEHEQSSQYITIEKGLGSSQILQILSKNNIIQAPLATKLYLRFFNDGGIKLQAGDYLFPSPISPQEVLAQLKEGKKRAKILTIPEGWTRFEIAKRLVAQFPVEPPLTEKDVLELMDDVSLIKEFAPEAKNLEGYLYPTSYEIELDAHPKSIINKMVKQFKTVWQRDWDELAIESGKTKHEIITIASLIENESKVDIERALVASVIQNRLEKGIPLGIDATNVYIAKLLNRWDGIIHKSDVEVDHPYNTRKIFGLPPGPIGSVSKTAIEAALNPAESNYIYYVLNVEKSDGSHHFYSTAAGFSKGKAAYQRWLAKQR